MLKPTMTLLRTVTGSHLSMECRTCTHSVLKSVEEFLQKVPNDMTVARVKKAARCSMCGRKTVEVRIVYVGNSALAIPAGTPSKPKDN